MQNEGPAAEPAEKGPAGESAAAPDDGKPQFTGPEVSTGEVASADEARVSFAESEADLAALKAKIEELKPKIAEKVREDSQKTSALTPEDSLISLDIYVRYGRIEVSTILTEMAAEERYLDIKMITSATGLIFVYSSSYLAENVAVAKSVVEEAKYLLASAIRYDSRQSVRLTPVEEIYAMAPDTDSSIIDILLSGMPSEPRYADITKATDSNGAVYYHSDTYLTGSYAVTLMLAMAGDHYVTIAETIREESRIYPRTTNVTIFRDQSVYGVPSGELETVLDNLLEKPEYSDIKRIVHPVTQAIHLFSETYISEASAWAMMDWEEVGRANNP